MERARSVVLGESDGEESQSREQPIEEELAETVALLSQRVGRLSFVLEAAFASSVATPSRQFNQTNLRCGFPSELSGRNGIGGPLRC